MGPCEVCRDLKPIRESDSYSFIWHGEYPSLNVSAETCRFCSILKEGLCAFCLDVGQVDQWNLFRRSIHSDTVTLLHRLVSDPEDGMPRGVHYYVTNSENPMATYFGVWHDLELDTGSAASLQLAKTWLEDCAANHVECRSSSSEPFLPTRVLDVSRLNGCVTLHETCQTDIGSSYTALSHCWGEGKLPRLLTSNMGKLIDGMLADELPKTFRDAVMVTRALGCRFLWIDSLCIIQDSKEDWKREASSLADIYSNAHVTLSAVSSPDSAGGLFYTTSFESAVHVIRRKGGDGDGAELQIHARPRLEHNSIFGNDATFVNSFDRFPLLTRSWCFQEHVLSTRILSFTTRDILWQCPHREACHCQPHKDGVRAEFPGEIIEFKNHDRLRSATAEELLSLWVTMTITFSSKNITFDRDKMPALSGVARLLDKQRTLGQYINGMWEHKFGGQLLWQTDWAVTTNTSVPRVERSTDTSAPSWTWIATNGPIIYPVNETMEQGMEVVGFETHDEASQQQLQHQHADLMSISTQVLLVRCELLSVDVWASKGPSKAFGRGNMSEFAGEQEFHWTVDVEADCTATRDQPMRAFVLYGGRAGLIVVPAAGRESTYRRIGMCWNIPPDQRRQMSQEMGEEASQNEAPARSVVRLV